MDLASDYDEKAATEEALRVSAHEASEVDVAHLLALERLTYLHCTHEESQTH